MQAYPKPSDIGGTLIRRVVAAFKERDVALPFDRPLVIAVSGGVDSMVLAHLICTYGRRIADRCQITLLHFDHQWRPESATIEKESVAKLAEQCGVGFESVVLEAQCQKSLSKNLEEDARLKRNAYYQSRAQGDSRFANVLTAHHADDVVETLIWRFFRGELFEQNEGILFQDNNVLRPFLQVTKDEILAYASAEKISYHEDPSNEDTHQMRAFFRKELKPILLKHFPGFRTSVLRYVTKRKKTS
jgi:tRNA(Ile)-lysidine synthetase-like protein